MFPTPELAPLWHVRRWVRRLRKAPRETLLQLALQNGWFLTRIPRRQIGSGAGLLTWARRARDRVTPTGRRLQISILEDAETGSGFAAITADWINTRSKACTAVVNAGLETADVIWIQTQDPMPERVRRRFLAQIAGAPAARVLNHPDAYDAYHTADAFARLERGGVRVPRSTFATEDVGVTRVVYKKTGVQAAPKSLGLYEGEKPGYRAFEYIDARDAGGLHTRFRAFYVAGAVRPSKVMRSRHWNVCLKHEPELAYSFDLSGDETRQIGRIAAVLGLDYFAVDFIRRNTDGRAFFIDINVYPTVESLPSTGRALGYHGRWHTFDTRRRLGLPEPGGRAFEEVFDEAMLRFNRAGYCDLW